MIRLLSCVLALMLLTACGKTPATTPTETTPAETASVETAAPTTLPPETEPPVPVPTSARTPMTDGELAQLRELFEADYSWYSQALTSYYEKPQDVSLRELFYNGNLDVLSAGDSMPQPTSQELETIRSIYCIEPDDFHTDCMVITGDEMDEVLKKLFGLSLDELSGVGMESLYYVPDTDRYFHFHGDTNAMTARLTDGVWLDEDTVEVHYAGGFNEVCTAVLENRDGHWLIRSNQTSRPME